MKRLRVDQVNGAKETAPIVPSDLNKELFDFHTWKYITSGALPIENARLIVKYLEPDQFFAFSHMAMTMIPLTFELTLVKFKTFSKLRQQRIIDIWFLYEEAAAWVGNKDPEEMDEYAKSCEQARDRLLKMAWGRATR